MSEEGLLKFKSEFAREIFKQDLYHIYDEQTVQRDKLRQESKERIAQIVSKMNSGEYKSEPVESLLTELSLELKTYNGKKVYGYLPKRLKNLVDGIVDEIAKKGDFSVKLGGENRDVAVLFVDIRGFTTMSEVLTPEEVVEILNHYLLEFLQCF